MSYFSELPNLQYISPYKEKTSNSDYLLAKNIFIRAKIRSDIIKNISSINYYYVKDNERPDQIAERIYGSAELDWLVLLTNNIIDPKNEWPLDNQSFEKYLLEKYGTEEKIYEPHHYETTEIKDQFDRIVFPGGFKVDVGFERSFTTTSLDNSYELPYYQNSNLKTTISINLNQYLSIQTRSGEELRSKIPDIFGTTSILKIYGRTQTYDATINNNFSNWPGGWGGILTVYGRSQNYNIDIDNQLGENFIEIPAQLYEIVAKEVNDEVVTFFNFIQE